MKQADYDPVVAPATYAELFDTYWEFSVGLVRKLGVSDSEDVASEILLRFYERDFLSEFKQDLEFDTRVGRRKARFQSFLSAFINSYCMGHRDRQNTRRRREPQRIEAPVGDSGALWIEVFGPALEESFAGVEARDLVQRIRAHLAAVPVRGKRDLARLFDLVVEQLDAGYPRPNRSELAAAFGVSDTAIGSMFGDLRRELSWVR